MPVATRSRLCNEVLAWADAFGQKRYVIGVVGVGNCFCGVPSASIFVSLKPFSFILSIDVYTTYLEHMEIRKKFFKNNVYVCSWKIGF